MPHKLSQSTAELESEEMPPTSGRTLEALARPVPSLRAGTLDQLKLLWGKRRFLAFVGIWALVISTLVVLLIPVRYESRAQIAPPESGSMGSAAAMLGSLAGKMGGLTSLAESALGVKSSGAFFVAILQSETVQDHLINKFSLQKVYHTRFIEDTRKELGQHTAVAEDRESGVITIVVTDHNPGRAAAMTQEYINELDVVVSNVSTSSARRERIFLEARLGQVKQELESAEQQFSQFASQKKAIDVQAQGKAIVEAGATLQGQLIAAESELEGFRQIYADQNVRVRSLQARVDELRQALQKMAGKDATENSSADQLYPSLRQLPLLGVDYADLFRRVKVEEAVFEILTQEYEMAKVQEARDIPTVKVLDPPLVPQKKSFPPRLLLISASITLAFLFGVLWVLGRSRWHAIDSTDPRKIFIGEMWTDLRTALQMHSKNGKPRDTAASGSTFIEEGMIATRETKSPAARDRL